MKNIFSSVAVAIVAVLFGVSIFTSCNKKDDLAGPESVNTRSTITVSGEINTSTTWYSSNIYRLDGKVFVTDGATLTIEEGTEIRGVAKTATKDASALIITRGSKIEAIGSETNPIVMTAENGQTGGWGGIVLLGYAITNQGTNQLIEGIDETTVPADIDVHFGGNNSSDNSGTLKYVRVEYAGASIAPTNELNAFTFGGVGSGTTLEHLQAYYGDDDSFEFFGGSVNAKYLVSTSPNDDNFDFDNGYRGKIQFAVATADPDAAYSGDPNGIECDNEASSPYSAIPVTHPVLSNFTIVGTATGAIGSGGNNGYLLAGARFRRGTQYTLVNSIICGYPIGIWNDYPYSTYICKYNVVNGIDHEYLGFTPDTSNVFGICGINDPFGLDYYTEDYLLPNIPVTKTGANFSEVSGFKVVAYKGAFNPNEDNWLTEAWVEKP